MTCAERSENGGCGDAAWAEDLVAAALGELPADAASRLDVHVATCAACRAELAATKRLFEASRAAPEEAPAADGEARLLAAFRAERAGAPVELPAPATRRRSLSRTLAMFVPLAAAAGVFVAIVLSSRGERAELLRGDGEFLPGGESGDASALVGAEGAPSFRFAVGDEIVGGPGGLAVRLALAPREGAASTNGVAPGRVELTLRSGARVRRAGASDVELVAGILDVAAGPLGRTFTVRGGGGAEFAVIKGTRFVATSAEDRLVVVVREGAVELGRVDRLSGAVGPSETLAAGEQGLVDPRRLLRRPADARADGRDDGDAFLAPRAELVRGPAPLEFAATLSVGDGGPVSIVALDDAYPNFVVRVRAKDAPDREIKLQRAMLTSPTPSAGPAGAWRLAADAPYRIAFSLAGIGLPAGRYDASIRYMSYRRHGDGAEWLGVAESGRTEFEVPAK